MDDTATVGFNNPVEAELADVNVKREPVCRECKTYGDQEEGDKVQDLVALLVLG